MVTVHSVSADTRYFEKDDYYARGGETLGIWTHGEKHLKENMNIDLSRMDKELVFENLAKNGVGSRQLVGKDLTFSAPKSVSIVWGIGDEKQKREIEEAHHAAVREALNYLDNNLALTRKTEDNITEVVKGNGITAIAYDHTLSRDKDPQLHTHVIVLNQTKREDGEVRALHYDEMFKRENLYTLDAIYKGTLSGELEKRGYKLEYDRDGKGFEISGITREQIEAFSQREQKIINYAEEHGLDLSDSDDRNRAILETRPTKERVNIHELEEEWRNRARDLGVSVEREESFHPAKNTEREEIVAEASRQSLSLQEGVFKREDFIRSTMEFYMAQKAINPDYVNIRITTEDVEKAFSGMQKRGDVITLGAENGRETYVSKEFLEAEKRIVSATSREKEAILTKEQFDMLKSEFEKKFREENGFMLNEEQMKALEMIYTSDRQYLGIQGYAGTGKTALFSGVRSMGELLEEKGIASPDIWGSAPTGQAAKEIQEKSRIESMTVNRMLNLAERYGDLKPEVEARSAVEPDINRHHWNLSSVKENPSRLIILDEAGMVDVRLMANVVEMADRMNARVILSGDTSQFQSVGSGRAFDLMQRNGLETAYITDIRRQQDAFLRDTAREIAAGNPTKAYEKLKGNGNIRTFNSLDEALDTVRENFLKDYVRDRDTFAIVGNNEVRDRLNSQIREELIQRGLIDGSGSTGIEIVRKSTVEKYIAKGNKVMKGHRHLAHREFAVGDRIILLKNDRLINEIDGSRFEIKNGNIGYIEDIEEGKLTVRIGEKSVKFSLSTYRNIDYAYAITAHKSQGATINHVHSLLDGRDRTLNRNAFYVHLTRTRKSFTGYVVNEDRVLEKITGWQQNKSALDLSGKPEKTGERDSKILDRIEVMEEKIKSLLNKGNHTVSHKKGPEKREKEILIVDHKHQHHHKGAETGGNIGGIEAGTKKIELKRFSREDPEKEHEDDRSLAAILSK